jgi:hypothetical protein
VKNLVRRLFEVHRDKKGITLVKAEGEREALDFAQLAFGQGYYHIQLHRPGKPDYLLNRLKGRYWDSELGVMVEAESGDMVLPPALKALYRPEVGGLNPLAPKEGFPIPINIVAQIYEEWQR